MLVDLTVCKSFSVLGAIDILKTTCPTIQITSSINKPAILKIPAGMLSSDLPGTLLASVI
jgi:hypothetical protein